MSSMEINAKDISKIIESCSKCGVKEFEFGELKIKFGPHFQNQEFSVYNEGSEAVDDTKSPQIPLEKQSQNFESLEDQEQFELFNDPESWDRRQRGTLGDNDEQA